MRVGLATYQSLIIIEFFSLALVLLTLSSKKGVRLRTRSQERSQGGIICEVDR
jgi:hypothetical protein